MRWTAPETLSMRFISRYAIIHFCIHQNRASDVWSYGVTLWELIEASLPYSEFTNEEVRAEVLKNGTRLPRPSKIEIPDSLWTLMQSCWHSSPQQRPTFDSLFAHLCAIEKELSLASTSDEEDDKPSQKSSSKQASEEHHDKLESLPEHSLSVVEGAYYAEEPKYYEGE